MVATKRSAASPWVLVLAVWVWMACCHAPCWSTDGINLTIVLDMVPNNASLTQSIRSSGSPPTAATRGPRAPSTMSPKSLPVSSSLSSSPHPSPPAAQSPPPPSVPSPAPYSNPDPSTSGPWSCLAQIECRAVNELGPPPELLLPFLPPPPLPSFMLDVIDSPTTSTSEGTVPRPDDGDCNLCEWANRNNDTEASTATSTTTEESGGGGVSEETTWISILVVASLASAAVGAILMIILIKCRKFKILPVADSCPILPESYFGSKSNQSATCQERHGGGGEDDDGSAITVPAGERLSDKTTQKPQAPHGGGGGWSFWRRSSAGTERPLRSSGSMCSEENSYSEEPYVVSEHSSALYAELNSVCQDGTGPYRTYSMNTYSEVSDPGGKVCGTAAATVGAPSTATGPRTHRRLISDGTYENAAYVVSENATESLCGCAPTTPQLETDSLDTPSSSAYYSDSSNQTNGRKRKKKQQRPLDDSRGRCDGLPTEVAPPCTVPVVAYFPTEYGSGNRLTHYVHERYCDPVGPVVVSPPLEGSGHGTIGTGKRPLPPAPAVTQQQQSSPPGLRSSMRPLPPVPSQYV